MSERDALARRFADLSDDALRERLRSDDLTDLAKQVAEREFHDRGLSPDERVVPALEDADPSRSIQSLDDHRAEGDVVTLAAHLKPLEAEIIKSRLEIEGIYAAVADAYLDRVGVGVRAAGGGARILVAERDFDHAKAVLANLQRGDYGLTDEDSQESQSEKAKTTVITSSGIEHYNVNSFTAILIGVALSATVFVGHIYCNSFAKNAAPWVQSLLDTADGTIDSLTVLVPAFIAARLSKGAGWIIGVLVGAIGCMTHPFLSLLITKDHSWLDYLVPNLAMLATCGAAQGVVAGLAGSTDRLDGAPFESDAGTSKGNDIIALCCGFLAYLLFLWLLVLESRATLNPPSQWLAWCTALDNFSATLTVIAPPLVTGWIASRRGFLLGAIVGALSGMITPIAVGWFIGHALNVSQGNWLLAVETIANGVVTGSFAGIAGSVLRRRRNRKASSKL